MQGCARAHSCSGVVRTRENMLFLNVQLSCAFKDIKDLSLVRKTYWD